MFFFSQKKKTKQVTKRKTNKRKYRITKKHVF